VKMDNIWIVKTWN